MGGRSIGVRDGTGREGGEEEGVAFFLELGAGVPPVFGGVVCDGFGGVFGKGVAVDPDAQLVALDCEGDVSGSGRVKLEPFVAHFFVFLYPADAELDPLKRDRSVPLPVTTINYLRRGAQDHLIGSGRCDAAIDVGDGFTCE